MTHDQFWEHIVESRRDFDPKRRNGNTDLQVKRMSQILSSMPAHEAKEFCRLFTQLYFDAYRKDLWAAAYIIIGGCGDDGFMDFRYWLISMGREVYEAALADPESLTNIADQPGVDVCAGEEFGPIVSGAPPHSDEASDISHPADPVGEPWTENDLPARFPKLWAKFGNQ